jgi:hypothetical protein
MLRVDAARRIRIEKIKRHPAFVSGLSSASVLLAPQQCAQFGDLIDLTSVT